MNDSTKRNTKEALGKFGIGAKAGLSTAPFYGLISRYNGREYHFLVYPHRIQSIVPQLNLETGRENGTHMFSNGAVIYYRETSLPNGVRVELESKKHHKQLYIDAVKSQLLYWPNVEFRIRNATGGLDVVPIAANILYEDDDILLSDNSQYSKPHILISRVAYGYIDFKELELEDAKGNIAFKIPAEQVTIKPSRESLVWDEKTRAAITEYFRRIKETATNMISEQLKVEDFVDWLEACSQIRSRYASDSIVGRLAQLVNLTDAKISYVKDPDLKYGRDMFDGLKVLVNTLVVVREGSTVKYKIDRSPFGLVTALADGLPVYVKQGNTSFKTDKYLLQTVHKDKGFITVQDPFVVFGEDGKSHRSDDCPFNDEVEHAAKDLIRKWLDKEKLTDVDVRQFLDKATTDVKTRMRKITGRLIQSPRVLWYDQVVVPEDFDSKEEVEDEKTKEEAKAKAERERIKREKGEIPIFTPRVVRSSYVNKPPMRLYEWQQINMPVVDIDQWDEEEVFFANDKDSELLHLAAAITRPMNNLTWSLYDWHHSYVYDNSSQAARELEKYEQIEKYYGSDKVMARGAYNLVFEHLGRCHNFFQTTGEKPAVKLIKVAMDRAKFFLDFKPIQRFFMDIKGKTLTMSNALVRWNTARLIHTELHHLQFLQNFERFHPTYHKWYWKLAQYRDKYYRDVATHAKDSKYVGVGEVDYQSLVSHMDKVTRFQIFVHQNPGEQEKIAELAQEMFAPKQEITDGLAIDMVLYNKLQELLEFSRPIRTLLGDINSLTLLNKDISEGLEHEIRFYIESKGVTLAQSATPTTAVSL